MTSAVMRLAEHIPALQRHSTTKRGWRLIPEREVMGVLALGQK